MCKLEDTSNVRTYIDREVEEEKIERILKLAMQASSSFNQQPWELIVVKNKDRLKDLSISTPYAWMVRDAGCAIVILGNLENAVFKETWDQDCSAVTEGILMGALQQNLGAFWLGVYPYEERMNYISDLFMLPNKIVPFAIIPLGYLTQKEEPKKYFNHKKVHYESWKQ